MKYRVRVDLSFENEADARALMDYLRGQTARIANVNSGRDNAEISYADLGKKLFVSGGTIHVRIKKLEEAKIVKGKRLNVDLKQLGYDVRLGCKRIVQNSGDRQIKLYNRQL